MSVEGEIYASSFNQEVNKSALTSIAHAKVCELKQHLTQTYNKITTEFIRCLLLYFQEDSVFSHSL